MQLNRESLPKAWRDMITIRRFEDRVQEEFSKGGIPDFIHLHAGQEASAVGVCSRPGPGDWIAGTHHGHGHGIAQGCDVPGIMLELFNKDEVRRLREDRDCLKPFRRRVNEAGLLTEAEPDAVDATVANLIAGFIGTG